MFHPILGLSVCLTESWIIKHIFTACVALCEAAIVHSAVWLRKGSVCRIQASPAPKTAACLLGREPKGIKVQFLFRAGTGG